MNAPTDLAALRERAAASTPALAAPEAPDYAVDLTTSRGFALAQRLAMALSTSTAVPAAFRSVALKRERRNQEWVDVEVDNPAAVGNCLVAIDTARSVGMSIISVMQNADIIEGKLRWSGKFKIAVVNSSGRFTELDFKMTRRGRVTVTYKEKGEYDRDARGYRFVDKTIEIDDVACVAVSERIVDGKRTGRIVEGPEVSVRMAVEEGWYAKAGSKWQGPLRDMMLMYRAGSYFADVYAPDLVMGMGMTSEEARDIADVVDVSASGATTTKRTSVPPVQGVVVEADAPPAAPPAAEAAATTSDDGPAVKTAPPPAPEPAATREEATVAPAQAAPPPSRQPSAERQAANDAGRPEAGAARQATRRTSASTRGMNIE